MLCKGAKGPIVSHWCSATFAPITASVSGSWVIDQELYNLLHCCQTPPDLRQTDGGLLQSAVTNSSSWIAAIHPHAEQLRCDLSTQCCYYFFLFIVYDIHLFHPVVLYNLVFLNVTHEVGLIFFAVTRTISTNLIDWSIDWSKNDMLALYIRDSSRGNSHQNPFLLKDTLWYNKFTKSLYALRWSQLFVCLFVFQSSKTCYGNRFAGITLTGRTFSSGDLCCLSPSGCFHSGITRLWAWTDLPWHSFPLNFLTLLLMVLLNVTILRGWISFCKAH